MRGLPILLVLLLATVPMASAQAPDPAAAVALACATAGTVDPAVREALPVCPREEPAGPASAEEAAGQDAPAPDPAAPQEPAEAVQHLASDARQAAEDSAQDPQGAPARLVGLVATVRQFVEDLLGLPQAAVEEIGARLDFARESIRGALAGLADAAVSVAAGAGAAARDARDAVADAGASAAEGARAAYAAVAEAARRLFADDPVAPSFDRGQAPHLPVADHEVATLLGRLPLGAR